MNKFVSRIVMAVTVLLFASVTAQGVVTQAVIRVGLVDQCTQNGVGEKYVSFVSKGGFEPVVLKHTTDKAKIAEMVAACDSIILCGGEDVEPSRYNEKPSPKLGKVNTVRDAWEYAVLDEAVKLRKPILGICRGCQILNVYFGGTLYQDLPTEFEGCASEGHRLENQGEHSIIAVPGSRFADYTGKLKMTVNSRHHQAVKKLGRGFKATAHSADGVVEVIENTEYPAIGVQFHPEMLVCDKGRKEFLNLLPRPRVKAGLYCDKGSRGKNVVYWAKILSGSPDVDVTFLDGKDVREGKLDGLDILVMPGGTGFGQYDSMLEEGAAKIRQYLRNGGKYFGTCAGLAVLMNEDKRIAILPVERIRGHYMRGGGDLQVKFEEKWIKELSLTNSLYAIQFHHGPVPVPGKSIKGVKIETVGVSMNAIDEKGQMNAYRRDSMIGTAAFLYATVDKGEILACNCHPEGRERTRDIISGVFNRLTGRRIVMPKFTHFPKEFKFKATGRDSVLKGLEALNKMQ